MHFRGEPAPGVLVSILDRAAGSASPATAPALCESCAGPSEIVTIRQRFHVLHWFCSIREPAFNAAVAPARCPWNVLWFPCAIRPSGNGTGARFARWYVQPEKNRRSAAQLFAS